MNEPGHKICHTFVVPAYKISPYLEPCLSSLKAQSIKSAISITTSTPSKFLEQVSRKYDIPLIVNAKSEGIAQDWTFAYDQCRTDYLTIAHQDDVYLPTYTQQCIRAAEKSTGRDNLIIFTGYSELTNRGTRNHCLHLAIKQILLLPFIFGQSINSNILKKLTILFGNPIPCSAVMYHKMAIGRFEFFKTFQCNMDWDAWLRFAELEGSFIYLKDKLVQHRLYRDSQTSRQIKLSKRQKEDLIMFERLWSKPVAGWLAALYSTATKFNDL